jgi:hypothetical protein
VALERWVHRRAGELRAALAGSEEFREPCHDAVAAMGGERVTGVLGAMGEERLRAKARLLAPDVERHGSAESLYRALARGLGLTRNVEPMDALAAAVPLSELRAFAESAADPVTDLAGVLLGAAGLLEGQLNLWPSGADGDVRLLGAWRAAGGPNAGMLEWASGPYRPGCGPRDRVAALAALAARRGPPLDCGHDDWQALLALGADGLLDCLRMDRLVGRDRAVELAVNAVLPWLLAQYGEDSDLGAAALSCYRALPAPQPYGSSRVLWGALCVADGRPLMRSAALAQGALQMTRTWCTRGGCGLCPLSPGA